MRCTLDPRPWERVPLQRHIKWSPLYPNTHSSHHSVFFSLFFSSSPANLDTHRSAHWASLQARIPIKLAGMRGINSLSSACPQFIFVNIHQGSQIFLVVSGDVRSDTYWRLSALGRINKKKGSAAEGAFAGLLAVNGHRQWRNGRLQRRTAVSLPALLLVAPFLQAADTSSKRKGTLRVSAPRAGDLSASHPQRRMLMRSRKEAERVGKSRARRRRARGALPVGLMRKVKTWNHRKLLTDSILGSFYVCSVTFHDVHSGKEVIESTIYEEGKKKIQISCQLKHLIAE